MKTRLFAIALALLLLAPSLAWAHGRGGHGHGWKHRGHHGHAYRHYRHGYYRHHPGFGFWLTAPLWYRPYRPYVVAPPPRVVERETVYVEREPVAEPEEAWWYYCESRDAYYPDVERCPEDWVRVPPSGEDPGW